MAYSRCGWIVPQVYRAFSSIDLSRARREAIPELFAERANVGCRINSSREADLRRRQSVRQRQPRNQCLEPGADLEAIPMIWHLLNGDDVLRFKGFAEILRGRRLWRPKSLNDEGRVDQDATDRCRDDPD